MERDGTDVPLLLGQVLWCAVLWCAPARSGLRAQSMELRVLKSGDLGNFGKLGNFVTSAVVAPVERRGLVSRRLCRRVRVGDRVVVARVVTERRHERCQRRKQRLALNMCAHRVSLWCHTNSDSVSRVLRGAHSGERSVSIADEEPRARARSTRDRGESTEGGIPKNLKRVGNDGPSWS